MIINLLEGEIIATYLKQLLALSMKLNLNHQVK
jgi:hypothetical protein